MYKALYRKYRPVTFDDMYGQEHIRSVLRRQCETGRLSHAYLFCGTRGTGKTTSAKILAKAVNCENPVNGNPCGICSSCVSIDNGTATDVLELDAASNNGVDDIRDICDELIYPPTCLKKRVYIIDEVHMLSQGAYNALLKTLEEPPEYIIFILATTELNKIPPTILSRCQRFEFRRIMPCDIQNCLLSVAKKEMFKLDAEAAVLLSKLADGSMRDGLSLLESCVSAADGKNITADVVIQQLGLANDDTVVSLLRFISSRQIKECLSLLEIYYNSSKSLSSLIEDMIYAIRDTLVYQSGAAEVSSISVDSAAELSNLISAEQLLYYASVLEETQNRLVRYPFNKRLLTEMTLIKLCDSKLSDAPSAILARIANLEKQQSACSIPLLPKTVITAEDSQKSDNFVKIKPKQAKLEQYDKFAELVEQIPNNNILSSILAQAYVGCENSTLIIRTSPFGINVIEKSIDLIKSAAKALDGKDYEIIVEEENLAHDKQNLLDEL